jgi:hypothetical protein
VSKDEAIEAAGVVVGFGRFVGIDGLTDEPGPESDWLSPLPFAKERVSAVASALSAARVNLLRNAPHLDPDCNEFSQLLRGAAEQGQSPVVLHLLSHGRLGRTGEHLYLATSHANREMADACSTCAKDGWDLQSWISSLEDAGGPAVLLLLDLCSAGTVTEWQWRRPRAARRVWVFGAAASDANAYQGQFSAAVAEVLEALSRDGLGTHPRHPVVGTDLVARRISDRMAQSTEDGTALPQEFTSTPAELHTRIPAFFRNPNFNSDVAEYFRELDYLEPGLAGVLQDFDPVLDPAHFLSRARGSSPLDSATGGSLFVGRERILAFLSDWVEDRTATNARPRRLAVLTGSPGTGKSSVLGMIVCAAHPQLSGSRHWLGRPQLLPAPQERFAAAHARSRDHNQIAASLARQLDLREPHAGWTAGRFLEALEDSSESGGPAPVLVIDAIDEARTPRDVVDLLLLPLIAAPQTDRDHRRARCRLLVGIRPWRDQFARLFSLASEHTLIDLDSTPISELRQDLETYGSTVLSNRSGGTMPRIERNRLAQAVADELTRNVNSDGARGAGSFLLASLVFQQLKARATISTVAELQVPSSLEHALDLHLKLLGRPQLRGLLATFAFAKGAGLPAELTDPIVEAAAAAGGEQMVDGASLIEDLERIRFYLRVVDDEDGTALYRLYHEGLAEHLRSRPREPGDSGE